MTPDTLKDTIAACATAPGEAGIAIVRMSGPKAEAILKRVFAPKKRSSGPLESHRLCLGTLHDNEHDIDECMAVLMRAPNSYTREDVAELQLHGGSYTVSACMRALTEAGARPAEPGEFTMRAFLNGRIDLSQAESVMQLIGASGERAARSALRQLQGGVSRYISEARDRVLRVLAQTEAAIDFPEEVDQQTDMDSLAETCRSIAGALEDAARETGARAVTEGISVTVLGPPNVGKSTLLNCLLGEDRAIVTSVPGTTRDVISGEVSLDGYRVILNDTAGLRDTEDPVEKLGIDRSLKSARTADLILWLSQAGQDPPEPLPDGAIRENVPVLRVLTKADLAGKDINVPPGAVAVSAKTAYGIDALKKAITARFTAPVEQPLTNMRHIRAAREAAKALYDAADTFSSGLSAEFAAVSLHEALDRLCLITGEQADEKLIDTIFRDFCVGK